MSNKRIQSFFRLVKAEKGHQFAGLYSVEKVTFKDGQLISIERVHEWDLRLISEAKLSQLGGSDAYENFKLEHEEAEMEKNAATVPARTPEELKALTQRKLNKELRLKADK